MTPAAPSHTHDQPDPLTGLRSIFVYLTIIVVFSILALFLLGNSATKAAHKIAEDESVINDLRTALSTLKDAETGQRGFLLTGREDYLAPNLAAKGEIEKRLGKLDTKAREGFLSAGDVAEFRTLSTQKLLELERTIQTMREAGVERAVNLVKEGSGKKTMDALRELTDRMLKSPTQMLAEDRAAANALGRRRTLLFLFGAMLNLATLGWAFRQVIKQVRFRMDAAQEVTKQKELLAVTLASIGDGVIVTDTEGRVTFLNTIAEKLTGWNLADAAGQPCTAIFNIINETTRTVVESPVEKVLRLGTVIGLANHTLLIRKDKSEIPIDDSGAPIHDSNGKIRGAVLVFRDFSDHKKAELALRLAMEDAQSANIAKDNFLATLSHELRTPLTPVIMTLESWTTNRQLPTTWFEDVEMMRRNLDLEARLIDDLLDLTRIVRGKLSLNCAVADVNGLLQSVAGMYNSELQSKRLHLTLDLHAAKHHVNVDPARLQQVFLNVLKNASKFTPEGGSITVATDNSEDGELRIHIHDTGIGMSEDTVARLFKPFEQGSDEVVKRYGGLGLGMAISKALVEAHGGAISAESDGPGKGSTFNIALPVCEPSTKSEPHPLEPAYNSHGRLKILLVEDHVDTARALSRLLERWHHEVHTAHTVAEALELLHTQTFNLMLSDIGLPDGTGVELIQKVRENHDLPAVALSGFGMEEDVNECRRAGFNDHLTKPINFQRLEMMIRQLVPGE